MQFDRQKVSRTRFHRALIVVGFFVLFWPAATTNLFGDGLWGYDPGSPAPRARLADWFDGSFQSAADEWWKERFGLRFFFVKLDNQINWSLFGRPFKAGLATLAVGPNDWLFEFMYISAYCSLKPQTPDEQMREEFQLIRDFQDAMDARGIPFVVMISPSKAAVYPNEIPTGHCEPHPGGGVDYDGALPIMKELGIRFVDGFEITRQSKALWPQITLFTQGGSHWNNLGAFYTANALLDAARPLADRPIPALVLDDVKIDNNPVGPDKDLVNFLNIFFPDTDFPTAHPEVSMPGAEDDKLRMRLIGTSFNEEVAMVYAQSQGFELLEHYWYYHYDIRDALGGGATPHTRETVDWARLLDTDLLVLELTMVQMPGSYAKQFAEDGLAYLASLEDTPSE